MPGISSDLERELEANSDLPNDEPLPVWVPQLPVEFLQASVKLTTATCHANILLIVYPVYHFRRLLQRCIKSVCWAFQIQCDIIFAVIPFSLRIPQCSSVKNVPYSRQAAAQQNIQCGRCSFSSREPTSGNAGARLQCRHSIANHCSSVFQYRLPRPFYIIFISNCFLHVQSFWYVGYAQAWYVTCKRKFPTVLASLTFVIKTFNALDDLLSANDSWESTVQDTINFLEEEERRYDW